MEYDYTQTDIVKVLCSLGIRTGNTVFVHSNLGFFGRCRHAGSAEALCKIFYDAFFEVIGPQGTLVVPTFTYSYCHGELYDPNCTVSHMGIFAEWLRKQPEAVRSMDPNFSVAAIGKRAKVLTSCFHEHSFGAGCFWEELEKIDGVICCMNFDAGTTFLHYLEKKYDVPYRFDKVFRGKTLIDGKYVDGVAYHFCVSEDKDEDRCDTERFHRICIDQGIAKTSVLGKGTVLVEGTKTLDSFVGKLLKQNPRALCIEK